MPWQITGLLFSSVFEIVMLFLVRGRLRTSTAAPFCLALLLNALWALGYAIELSVPNLADKTLIFQIRCSILCFYAPVWIETVHRMTRDRPLLRGWTMAAIFVVPVITLLLIWFPGPGQNPLLRHGFWIDTAGGIPVLRNTFGPFGIIYYIYNYLVWAVVFLLLYPRRHHTFWERRGRLLILAAALVGWTTDALHLIGVTHPTGLNYAPIFFPLTSALVAAALLRHRMLDLAPVARAALIEQLEDRIIVLDDQDYIVDHNQAAAATLNLPKNRTVGRAASELLSGWPALLSLMAHPEIPRLEVEAGGLTFEASLFNVFASDGKRARARVLILRDITRRKETETQLRLAKDTAEAADHAQSRFLATMSHEIRTPMNGVIGFTHMLKETPLNSQQLEYLDLIDHSSRSLLVIVNDVLDYSKIAAGQLDIERVPCDLNVIIAQTSRLLLPVASEKHITLVTRVADNVPPAVVCDPVRITQVLTNLIGNAIKFTETGGVTLEVESQANDLIVFKVTDTGIGIAPENQSRIFTPFNQADASTTRRFGGTGLGLSITRRLCELMGGDLTLSSRPGEGSIFTATICAPAASSRIPDPQPTQATASGLPRRPLKLLVCEDNAVNQAVIRAFLRRLGHEVSIVDNGEKGIDLLTRESFDAVLMDLEMPVMDGYEAVRRIRSAETRGGPRTYIIALTAHALKGERERCLALDMNDFITKPLDLPTLVETLAAIPRRP